MAFDIYIQVARYLYLPGAGLLTPVTRDGHELDSHRTPLQRTGQIGDKHEGTLQDRNQIQRTVWIIDIDLRSHLINPLLNLLGRDEYRACGVRHFCNGNELSSKSRDNLPLSQLGRVLPVPMWMCGAVAARGSALRKARY